MEVVVIETFKSLKEYIPKMIVGCQDTVKKLQEDKEASAIQLLPFIVEGLDWIIQAISGLKNNGQLQHIELYNLSQHFQEIVSALEIGDYVLLADLLDYEIIPVLEEWLKVINLVSMNLMET